MIYMDVLNKEALIEKSKLFNSHYIGKITELEVAKSFLSMGYQVSFPLVPDSRYDFIADIKGKLYKIQVKTSTPKDNESCIDFSTSTSHTNSKRTINIKYSPNDVDYFATMYNGQCYVVPIDKCLGRGKRLRLKPTKNGQNKGILFAKDFKLEDVFPST